MNATIKLLKQLMEFHPVSDDIKSVNKCVSFLENYLSSHNVYTRLEKLNNRRILYAGTYETKTPSLLFNAHLDVVPADAGGFTFKQKNGWIFGRGSADCLGNSAVLAQMLIHCKGRADAGVIFSTDEEIGGYTTKAMIDKGYCGKVLLILDKIGPAYEVALAQKGVLTLKLIARGKSCHGSEPWTGKNAIDRLIQGYTKIKTLFPAIKKGNEWHTTVSANVVSAGTVFNRVPDYAEMILDIRYTEETLPKLLARRIRDISGLKVKIESIYPLIYCERSEIVSELIGAMQQSLKHKIKITRLNAATDARYFAALKLPIIMLGIPSKNPHASDEKAQIKGMLLYQKMFESLCGLRLNALCKSGRKDIKPA